MTKKDTDKPKVTLVSFIPNLVGMEAHVLPYHQSVGKAANIIDWQHIAMVAPHPSVEGLPSNWIACLSEENLERDGNFIQQIPKIISACNLGINGAQCLRKHKLFDSEQIIIFLERFIHLQLLALVFTLLFISTKKVSVWLLYRRDIHTAKTKFIYKFLTKIIKIILQPGKLQLLTDSELLSQSLSNYFREPVMVMPIPHTDVGCGNINLEKNDSIICWWPGAPRLEKGLEIMKSLVNCVTEEAQNICVVAAQSSGLVPIIDGVKVEPIKNNLTRVEYSQWLMACNIVLMPYDSDAYSERTSGIFTECIIAGKIPMVTNKTWMANELYKYDLEELVIEWEDMERVILAILKIWNEPAIITKIANMRKQYANFHNPNNFAQKMYFIFEKSCH